jgi:hypothetical protein
MIILISCSQRFTTKKNRLNKIIVQVFVALLEISCLSFLTTVSLLFFLSRSFFVRDEKIVFFFSPSLNFYKTVKAVCGLTLKYLESCLP